MRIVGGARRGLVLASPESGDVSIRPTSDRLREAIFNVLAHGYGDPVEGARVLDLFAGTGALGLEAMSRGAAFATFVDNGPDAQALIRRNLAKYGGGGMTLLQRDVARMGPAKPLPPFSLVFCDPPYGRGLGAPALAVCRAGGWFAPDALIVVEEAAEAAFAFLPGIAEQERRLYGATEIVFGRNEV
ncbi:16S rRNA (guanine(966)-N(2))-methyltransferase RsmD [uncultured Enterovirga sp.]|uniref:16S rRNA (guanine(966)-N(2))-methyltransferase RsmD n=1 Tax=uncultured Enterovirga sp. TaxID=2026352 RepID=UPI0035CA4689